MPRQGEHIDEHCEPCLGLYGFIHALLGGYDGRADAPSTKCANANKRAMRSVCFDQQTKWMVSLRHHHLHESSIATEVNKGMHLQ